MKTRTLPNNKLILLGAFLAAIIFPYAAGAVTSTTSTDQNVKFELSKAVEVVNAASADINLGTTAPLVGSSSFTRELSGSGNINGGYRSNAAATATVQQTAAPTNVSSKLYVQDPNSTFQELTTTQVAANLARSTSNNLMPATSASFKLPISWADEAGAKQFTIRTIVGNGS
jgi:hypothetical protein